MVEIVWTEPALQSLDEIADYISLDNLKAAQALVEKVFDRVELL
ncbi:MAG: type II toxin-antitoxin system RelE/ParE family toxin, partial [Balneola sp.]